MKGELIMYIGFNLFRDDSIKDLDSRLQRINEFLRQQLSIKGCKYRHFGVFLLPPGENKLPRSSCYLAERQSNKYYRLCIEFFDATSTDSNATGTDPLRELEIVYNLGTTPEIYDTLKADVSAISYLCACTECEEVTFVQTTTSLYILFNFDDSDPNIKRIKNHLEFLIPQSVEE
jgi:hypothetical protein